MIIIFNFLFDLLIICKFLVSDKMHFVKSFQYGVVMEVQSNVSVLLDVSERET